LEYTKPVFKAAYILIMNLKIKTQIIGSYPSVSVSQKVWITP